MVYSSYADASGAGNDVYEFVCRDYLLSAHHFILLHHITWINIYSIARYCELQKMTE